METAQVRKYTRFTKKEVVRFRVSIAFLVMAALLALLAPWFAFLHGPNELNLDRAFLPPFSPIAMAHGFWLGTDQLGRDVFSNLLYGFYTAFRVALPVSLIAILTGTMAGAAAGFFGNRHLKLSLAKILAVLCWVFLMWFYFMYAAVMENSIEKQTNFFTEAITLFLWVAGITGAAWVLGFLFKIVPFLAKKRAFPLDEAFLKLTEVLSSVPRLILILCMAALFTPGTGNVILLLSLTFWAGPARLIRAEVLKIKQLPYIEAAQAAGLTRLRILTGQVLPNIAGPVITAFCFGLSGLLSLEATLSFLGIGLPPETPGWGRLMATIRLNFEAWWLLVFPAITLTVTILAIQTAGNFLQKAVIKK